MPEPSVDDLIRTVAERLTPERSLHEVARDVWAAAELVDTERQALENVAFGVLIDDGEPPDLPAGELVMAMVRGGAHYDRTRLSDAERDRLAYLGFLALTADTLAGEG
jgi:hypothetical protein